MQAFRDIVKGWFGKVILAVICLLFVLLGSEALLSLANKPVPIAIVEGEEISRDEVVARAERQKQLILQQYRGQVRPEFIDDELLKASVLDGMIKRILMMQFIDENQMGVPQSFAQDQIVSNPDFQEDGKFSKELFDRLVTRIGLTPAGYLDEIRFSSSLQSFESIVRSSAFTTPAEIKYTQALEEQKRSFKYARFSHETFKPEVELTAEQINTYYEENSAKYMAQEAVKVDYVVFDYSDVEKDIELTEEQVKEAYDRYVEQAEGNEKREAAHILLETGGDRTDEETEQLATELLERVKSGEDFSALAKEFSDDIGSKEEGGSLGAAGKGDFLPEFEEVMFALDEGEISDVVKTQYGFHIIKLTKIITAETQPFEDKKADLEESLKQTLVDEAFLKLEEELTDVAFEQDDLTIFTENYAKKIQATDWITRTKGDSVFKSPEQIEALFAVEVVEDNRNSSWIALGADKGAIARLATYRPEAVKPIAEVKPDIEQLLLIQESSKLATAAGQKMIARLKTGESFDTVSEEFKVEWVEVEPVDRRSTKAPFSLVSKVFSLPKPKGDDHEYGGAKEGADFLAVVLKTIETPSLDESTLAADALAGDAPNQGETEESEPHKDKAKEMKEKLNAFADRYGNIELGSFLEWLESVADIERLGS